MKTSTKVMMAVLAIAIVVAAILIVKRKQLFDTPHMVIGDCASNAELMGTDPMNSYYEGVVYLNGTESALPQPHDDDTDCFNYWVDAYEQASSSNMDPGVSSPTPYTIISP